MNVVLLLFALVMAVVAVVSIASGDEEGIVIGALCGVMAAVWIGLYFIV